MPMRLAKQIISFRTIAVIPQTPGIPGAVPILGIHRDLDTHLDIRIRFRSPSSRFNYPITPNSLLANRSAIFFYGNHLLDWLRTLMLPVTSICINYFECKEVFCFKQLHSVWIISPVCRVQPLLQRYPVTKYTTNVLPRSELSIK